MWSEITKLNMENSSEKTVEAGAFFYRRYRQQNKEISEFFIQNRFKTAA